MNSLTTKKLTANSLKYIAIVAMLIDHIAWAFLPFNSTPAQVMHIIGRITMPLMCFFIAEGFYHTKNINRYILRLGIFSVISYFAYTFFGTGKFLTIYNAGVIFTLLLGLFSIIIWKDEHIHITVKIVLTVFLCIFSIFGDWPLFGVLYCLAFGLNRGKLKNQIFWFSIVSLIMFVFASAMSKSITETLFHLGVFLAVPLLLLYNGERGKGGQFNKWIFYIFYPLHLIVIGFIRFYIL